MKRYAMCRSGAWCVAASFALVLGSAFTAGAADVVVLKNGTVLEGEIVESGNAEVVLNTGVKDVPILRSEIRKLTEDKASRAEFARRFGMVKRNDANAFFELHKFAKEARLYSLADKALEATVTADPNHAQARKALGYVYFAGVWMTAEEAEKSRMGPTAATGAAPLAVGEPTAEQKELTAEARKAQRAYEERIAGLARTLAGKDASEKDLEAAKLELLRDHEKAGDTLLGVLNFREVTDEAARLGALKALDLIKHKGANVSPVLAWTAVMDPAEGVREKATALVKERKDEAATAGIMRHLIGAFDKQGNVVNAPVRDAAVKALRSIGDERVLHTLAYYATLEMRPTVTELASFNTRQIDSYTVNQGAAATVLIPLSFPVQFPELRVTRVRTTVCAPASAYHALKGD